MEERLSSMFKNLKGKRAALISYATGFFPDPETSEDIIKAMFESGADAVEIGLPFSDPVMDGAVIQETSRIALDSGSTTSGILKLAERVRTGTDKPILIMSYYNPVFKYGLDKFARHAAESGVDGVIIPDLPIEEMPPLKEECDRVGLATVAFCSETTGEDRIETASRMSSGFMYCISLLGTTGMRDKIPAGLADFLNRVREKASCPIAVGVGISTPAQCREVGRMADGVIVGSALMDAVIRDGGKTDGLKSLVRGLAGSLAG